MPAPESARSTAIATFPVSAMTMTGIRPIRSDRYPKAGLVIVPIAVSRARWNPMPAVLIPTCSDRYSGSHRKSPPCPNPATALMSMSNERILRFSRNSPMRSRTCSRKGRACPLERAPTFWNASERRRSLQRRNTNRSASGNAARNICCQSRYATSHPARSGPALSPTDPADRSTVIMKPLRWGYVWDSRPRAVGCHIEPAIEATPRAASIST